jgi:hypothetical protein
LKFFRQNNYTEKAKILYFLNLVYFLSLVGLWQNHMFYWPLTDLMWHNNANIELAYPYNKVFNPVNLVFLPLSMQYIRLTTYYHIFVKQLMTDFCLFQSHLLSQNGPFYRKWLILPGKYIQVLSISHKWPIILHFHCCFNNKYTPYFLV